MNDWYSIIDDYKRKVLPFTRKRPKDDEEERRKWDRKRDNRPYPNPGVISGSIDRII